MPSVATTIGSATPALAALANISFTSTAAVPSGGKVEFDVAWNGAFTLTSVTIGGNAATIIATATNGADHFAKAYIDLPSGIATSQTVQANFSGAALSRHLAASYVTGVATGNPSSTISGTSGTTTYTSGTLTSDAGGYVGGGDYSEGATAATSTGDNVKVHQTIISGDTLMTSSYAFGTGGAMAATGTVTGGTLNTAFAATWAPSDAAVAKTLFMTNNLADTAHQEASQANPGAIATASPVAGWILGTVATGNYGHFDAQTELAVASFNTTVKPGTTINTGAGAGNALRSVNPWNGIFPTGNWTLSVVVRSVTAAYAGRFRIRARLYKTTSTDGASGNTVLSGASDVLSSATAAALTTSADTTLTVTFTSVPQTTFTNEYILVAFAAEPTTAGTAATQDADLRIGTGGTLITTPAFPLIVASASSMAMII